jgi:aspartyl/asparaginyl beta-hydroxylase (cupin superfamily)
MDTTAHDPRDFGFIQAFQENWEAIRAEALGLDPTVLDVHRSGSHEQLAAQLAGRNGWVPSWQVGSKEANRDWLTYGVGFQGRMLPEAASKYPVLHGVLSRLQGYKVCAFSQMMPKSFIAPHVHPELGDDLLTFHLGLDVPRHCYLNVDGTFHAEQDGKALVFDGSREHFAMNMGDRPRTILYMEFSRSRVAAAG